MKNQWITYSILLFCVIAWGSNFVFGSILVQVFDPSVIAFLRLVFILIFLFFVTSRDLKHEKLSMKSMGWLALSGFIGITINQWSFYASLQYTEPVTAALILALSPVVTAVISSHHFKEKVPTRFWIGSIIAFIGVWLVITKGSFIQPHIGKGEILIFITMLSFSVFLVFVQQLSKSLHPSQITWYSNVFGMIGLLPFVPMDQLQSVAAIPAKYWLLLIITAVIMHGLCTYLWNNSIQKVGASKAALLLNFETFVAMVFSFFLLGTDILPLQLVGAIVIVVGVTVSLWSRTDHRAT